MSQRLQNEWRAKNIHNFTKIKRKVDISRIKVGKNTYGDLIVFHEGSADVHLMIGSYCSIGQNVQFLLADEHPLSSISTYPFKTIVWKMGKEALSKGDITVSHDAWIGANAIICSGVSIGQGAVIGAGAVVTKDVPPYAIVGGVPARIIRYRFSDALCNKLLSIDIEKLFDTFTQDKAPLIYKDLDEASLQELMDLSAEVYE